ncbi:MAG: protein-L-isoaspartate O-methyltransferase, partial [Halobacteria archaeon]|nr:protein-L-isoaspartate O-methyltransferase [Halobacteria archaeon]
MQANLTYRVVTFGLARLVFVVYVVLHAPLFAADEYISERLHLIQLIEQDVKATSAYLKKETLDPRVLAVMATVPRHKFVPRELKSFAYRNRPLPIGHGQTISQPYIVAIMTDLIAVKPDSKVLEIGTGSGYQAAIMAELVSQVFSIEIIKPLGELAAERLSRLGYENVNTKIGDGYYGWEEHAPFDAII